MAFHSQVYPASLLGVCAGYCQTYVVNELGMIRTQTGAQNRLEMVAEGWDVIRDTTLDSNRNSNFYD
jgi:hypothetical protein